MKKLGWYSRGYLPHCDIEGRTQFLTFRLADAIPKRVIEQVKLEIAALPQEKQDPERRKRLDKWLDAAWARAI